LSLVKEIMYMKKLNLAFAILLTAVMAGNAAPAYSDVAGYQVQSFPKGNTVHTVTFVKPNLFQGVASSKTDTSLIVTTATFGSYGLVDGSPTHYVKILDGPLVGYVFDIISSTSTAIVVDGNLGTAGTTPKFLVREHIRLADVFATSTGLSDGSDTFTLFNSDGSSTVALRAKNESPSGWIDVLTEQPKNPVIYPNQGFLLTTANSGTFTFAKNVETTPTVVPLYARVVNLVSRASPGSNVLTPGELGMGNAMAPGTDTIEWWRADGSLASQDVGLWAGPEGFIDVLTEAPKITPLDGNTVLNVTVVRDTVFTAPAPYTPAN